MASFYASELEARSTQSRRASLSSRTGVPPSRQLAVPVAQLWKDAVRSVIAAAVAETLPHSHDPLPAGKHRARSTLLDDFADRQSAAGALALQLDLACVARVLASTPERVASAPKRSAHLSIAHFVSWSAGYIRTATNILRRLRSFTANAKTVDGLQLASFLDHVDRDARRKMTAKSTSSSAAGAPAEVDGFVRTDAGGSTAAVSALNSLKWLSVNAGIMLPIHAPALGRFKGKKADASAASPSVCLSLRAVTSLDINSKKEGNNEFVQGHCAAWAFLHYSVSRLAQAQRASFVLDRDHARTMVTAREKTPIVRAARPRAFWAPSRGIDGAGYLSSIDAMLSDLHKPSFVLRDTDSPDGDPRKATKWSDEACMGPRATKSLRACLELAVEMTPSEAKWYSPSTARHFLPLVARMRGESAERRNELGRWSGSSSSDASVLPTERAAAKAARTSAAMPNRYAGAAVPAIVTGIICAQITACSSIVSSRGLSNLPVHGGFHVFAEGMGSDGDEGEQPEPS